MSSTKISKKEYHLFIYKGDKNKTYIYIIPPRKETLNDSELKRIANQYYKTSIDNLEIEHLYRRGKDLFDCCVYKSVPTTVVTRKKK